MRIQGYAGLPPATLATAKRSTEAGPAGFGEALRAAGSRREAAAVSAPLASAALLALQEVEDSLERRRRAVRRGEQLLDGLAALQRALLAGEIDPEVVGRLAGALRARVGDPDDPGLAAVIREIEVRAAVEIAKYEGRAS
ncbi:Flagellar assembly protein FliX [bacterium HR40]|nr:Flagellar assembly protein FliX [bacterium HR40]